MMSRALCLVILFFGLLPTNANAELWRAQTCNSITYECSKLFYGPYESLTKCIAEMKNLKRDFNCNAKCETGDDPVCDVVMEYVIRGIDNRIFAVKNSEGGKGRVIGETSCVGKVSKVTRHIESTVLFDSERTCRSNTPINFQPQDEFKCTGFCRGIEYPIEQSNEIALKARVYRPVGYFDFDGKHHGRIDVWHEQENGLARKLSDDESCKLVKLYLGSDKKIQNPTCRGTETK